MMRQRTRRMRVSSVALGALSVLLLCWLLSSALLTGGVAHAAGAMGARGARGHAAQGVQGVHTAATSGHVTIIVLDMSGSMQTNDPTGVRCSAANGYIDLSGPGDFIGVVGLDNNSGARGGRHNFQLAQVYAQPTEMATVNARNTLKAGIAQQSHNCQPDVSTPTYDALAKALTMLASATQGGKIPGSVILLTDGQPDPDGPSQIAAVKSDLIPQFQQHNWQVDTVGLGVDQGFYGFLSDLSNATSGKFYDDGKGVVSGVSPLNIAPFFVDIFARQNGRVLGPTVAPTQPGGGTVSRNFDLPDYVDHLDVIVVKDDPGEQVSLNAPNGQTVSPLVAGGQVLPDAHYVMFSIEGPQQGAWQVNVTGNGTFLLDSLVVSSLAVSITSPSAATASHALPLGQPLTVAATVTYQGSAISGGQFSIKGRLTYSGNATSSGGFDHSFDLTDGGSGNYQAVVTVPDAAPAGAYALEVTVSAISNTVISSSDRALRLELFPVPLLRASQTGPATYSTSPAQVSVVRWWPEFQWLYGLSFVPMPWLGSIALQGLPAQADADVPGQVELHGAPYAKATVTGTATQPGSHVTVPVQVINDGAGRFHVLFPSSANGTYLLTFLTTGSFADSHGDFGVTHATVNVTIVPATLSQETIAILYTLLYLALLALIILTIRYFTLPSPAGEYLIGVTDPPRPRRFNTRRSLWMRLRQRNMLPSRPSFGKDGLQLLVWRRSVSARRRGRNAENWFDSSGRPLTDRFRRVAGVQYLAGRARRSNAADGDAAVVDAPEGLAETYTFPARGRTRRQGVNRRPNRRGGNANARRSSRRTNRRAGGRGASVRSASRRDDDGL